MNNRFLSSRWAKKWAGGRSQIFFFFLIKFLYKLECTGKKVNILFLMKLEKKSFSRTYLSQSGRGQETTFHLRVA